MCAIFNEYIAYANYKEESLVRLFFSSFQARSRVLDTSFSVNYVYATLFFSEVPQQITIGQL